MVERAGHDRAGHDRSTAFVLGGGGVLGAHEVGMLQALAEAGIRPDLVVGTSVGAVNGVLVAADPAQAVPRLLGLWRDSAAAEAFGGSLFGRVATLARSGTHLHSNQPLRRLLDELLPVERIEDLAVLALGARVVYVLHVGRIERPLEVPRRPWEVGLVAFEIARRYRFAEEMASLPRDVTVHVLPAGITGVNGQRTAADLSQLRYRDFSRVDEHIERAHEASAAYLAGTGEQG